MGCELRDAEADVVSDQGDVLNARYLFNPDNGAFVPILDLGDDEFVSSGEVAFWGAASRHHNSETAGINAAGFAEYICNLSPGAADALVTGKRCGTCQRQ